MYCKVSSAIVGRGNAREVCERDGKVELDMRGFRWIDDPFQGSFQ